MLSTGQVFSFFFLCVECIVKKKVQLLIWTQNSPFLMVPMALTALLNELVNTRSDHTDRELFTDVRGGSS